MNASNKLQQLRKVITQQAAVKQSLQKTLEELETDKLDEKAKKLWAAKTLSIIQIVGRETQQQLEYRISELSTIALESVFDEPYQLRLIYEIKRNQTESRIVLEREGIEFHPLSSTGGGVVDTVGFALRVSLWNLAIEKTKAVLVLDEPFKFLSQNLVPVAAQMLQEISKKLGMQIIMVTHMEPMIESADKVFRIINQNGISKVKKDAL